MFITVAYVLVNFVVDLMYAALDPRIRVRRMTERSARSSPRPLELGSIPPLGETRR